MKKIIFITLVAALMVSLVSFAAFAKENAPGPGPRVGRGGPGMFKDLNLTIDQQQKILKIRQEFQKETMDLRFSIQNKRLELKNLWNTKPLNQAAIETKTKEIAGLRVQIANKAQVMMDKIKAVLTPEQLKTLQNNAQGRPNLHCWRKGDCGHRGME